MTISISQLPVHVWGHSIVQRDHSSSVSATAYQWLYCNMELRQNKSINLIEWYKTIHQTSKTTSRL